MDIWFDINDYDFVSLDTLGFPDYWLLKSGAVWSTIQNRWLTLDAKGCVLIRHITKKFVRMSVRSLVSQMFIEPELLLDGFVHLWFDGRYLINNNGIVYSTINLRFLTWMIIKQYAYVRIGEQARLVHRLVAETFLPNDFGYNEVNHIDGNKLNNSVWNLEWCDRSMNMKHAYEMGFLDDSLKKAQLGRHLLN